MTERIRLYIGTNRFLRSFFTGLSTPNGKQATLFEDSKLIT